ncbi:hypothetical protein E0Z10_g6771 [Xylaria hypoxylon]|uniref:Uncharacterized protein n=1 Tax=Xylaria hypoxylon TaxID=37992 RepID=A0A4Z0YCN9_9PEZI|nr:hypothetical protein E0Z10_g6771 [Xylaria hypoxylon]
MLRGATIPPSELGQEVGAHRSRMPTRPSRVYEQSYEETSLRPTTPVATTFVDSNTSNYRQHQPQQSSPSFSPRRFNAPPLPPVQGHNRKHSQGMPLTGDGRGGNSPGRGRRSGTSTPSVEYDTTPFHHQTRTPVDTTPKSTAQTRLGFLASSVSAFTSRMTSPTQAPARTDDELCDLDIEAALFPAQSPIDGDTFSPAAYKNLQTNATGLLHRMQDAYRQRTIALRGMQAEREAQIEEMEEMELRTRHFKNQLEKMAAKAAEQESAMQQLVAELQAEKRARHEERVSREKMFRVAEEGSVVGNEDLCVDEDERKRWRESNGTVKSELSIDTDGDSAESESIFSRSRSPTAMTAMTETESLDVPPSLHPRAALPKPKSAQQLTAFQRLVKGISAIKEEGENSGSGVDGCRNCRGQDSSVAWNTVSLLRDENIALKQRVAHLDVVVEGALDVVNGIRI